MVEIHLGDRPANKPCDRCGSAPAIIDVEFETETGNVLAAKVCRPCAAKIVEDLQRKRD